MKKFTLEYVIAYFEQQNCKLVSDKYTNSLQKLDYICVNKHNHSISFKNFRKGRKCSYCTGNFRKDIEFIKLEFVKENYELLTNVYINSIQKLDYICPNGHTHMTTWNNWQSGYRCSYCAGNAKMGIEFVRSEFERENYVLVSNKYINSKKKLKYICSSGHEGGISLDSWKHGKRCYVCGIINRSGFSHYNWKGGISCEPYCEIWTDKEYKEDMKARDNYECQNPDCRKIGAVLCLHHIDYNKKNCNPMNLISICKSCNARANFNREWHTNWYQIIMNKKYGYAYE